MNLTADDLKYLSIIAIEAATKAGQLIASNTNKSFTVQHKQSGSSPASQVVTEVDFLSERTTIEILQPCCSRYDIALLAEETTDDRSRLDKDFFWCIDPLDGTLCFVESIPGYAVSIALVSRAGTPYIGVVYDPFAHTLYSAVKGLGALRNRIPWSLPAEIANMGKPLTLIVDRSIERQTNYEDWIEKLNSASQRLGFTELNTVHKGGAVMSACWALDNSPSCYFKRPKPEEGGGSLWDFAATACIYNELGCVASDFYGNPLKLNKKVSTFMNHDGILYATHPKIAHLIQTCH